MRPFIPTRAILCTPVLIAALSATITTRQAAFATEAMIVAGGSHVHDSGIRYENSVRWVGGVLTDHEVTFTTHFNDGQEAEPDIFYTVANPTPTQPLTAIFSNSDLDQHRFRNHDLENVVTGTQVENLLPAISSRLKQNVDQELLLIHIGRGGHTGAQADGVAMNLWDHDTLSAAQLHQLLRRHDRSVRFVIGHTSSGGFHRLAYRDVVNGLALTDTTHCGFSAQSAYGVAEFSTDASVTSNYRDYLSYFFSALSGYEYDGQIISRFADLNDDGQTSLREAHLYSLEEALSLDLPLSTSEDYLLRWQPWYLRWQPAQKTLPNNEYTRIFRSLANRLGLSLDSNVAKVIREKMAVARTQVKALEQQLIQDNMDIARLQETLQTALIARWPALASPYSHGYETLITSGQLPVITSFGVQLSPEYETLKTRQARARRTHDAHLEKRREAAQFEKLLRLRHLALVKQQLIQNGTGQQVNDYRLLLRCEQEPLTPTSAATLVSEETTQ